MGSTKTKNNILYNIPPIGVGTMEIESLSSYISRVASSHCIYVGDLINKILIYELKKKTFIKTIL